jgi:hypothetical protein
MSRLKNYHFDVGNSTKGSIGMCLRVQAHSKKEAVKIANDHLDANQNGIDVPEGDGNTEIEYCEVYLKGNLTTRDIDEVNSIE